MRPVQISLLLVLGATAAASADTVSLQLTGQGPGRNVTTVVGGSSSTSFAGAWNCTLSGGTGSAAGVSGTYPIFAAGIGPAPTSRRSTWTFAALNTVPDSGDPTLNAGRTQAIHNLFASPLAQQAAIDAQSAAAFQMAIWEVAYDYIPGQAASLDLSAGNLRILGSDGSALDSGMVARVSEALSTIGDGLGPQPGLTQLTNIGGSELLVVVAPIPPAAATGLAGIALAWAARRRVRR